MSKPLAIRYPDEILAAVNKRRGELLSQGVDASKSDVICQTLANALGVTYTPGPGPGRPPTPEAPAAPVPAPVPAPKKR